MYAHKIIITKTTTIKTLFINLGKSNRVPIQWNYFIEANRNTDEKKITSAHISMNIVKKNRFD